MSNLSRYDYINFKKGHWDSFIDAIYVITLEKSKRQSNVYKQINKFKLCKRNIIQINKKYTESYNPELYKQNSSNHLLYNNIQIFKHAESNDFNNILILEDDFIFDDNIENNIIKNKFEKFINKNKDFNLIYLGNIPLVFNIFNYSNLINVYINGQAHSIIYSKNARNIIIDNYNNKKRMWIDQHDIWYNFILNKRYFYYKNICYQVQEETENKKLWSNCIFDIFIKLLEFDKYNIDNYNYFYIYIYILHYITLILIIYYIYKWIGIH